MKKQGLFSQSADEDTQYRSGTADVDTAGNQKRWVLSDDVTDYRLIGDLDPTTADMLPIADGQVKLGEQADALSGVL